MGCALDILINILAELIGHSALEIARYITHFIVLFDIVAACVVYQNDLKNIFQKVSTSRNIELHNSNDELRASTGFIAIIEISCFYVSFCVLLR